MTARSNMIETVMGAVVLLVAAGFLYFAYTSTHVNGSGGYTLTARFDRVDGLNLGSDVRISGLKVGSVSGLSIDPETYQAMITFSVSDNVKLPKDSSGEIVSDGLLGSKYLALVPGGAMDMLPAGAAITHTQSSVSIEQLIGKFMFGAAEKKKSGESNPGSGLEGTAP